MGWKRHTERALLLGVGTVLALRLIACRRRRWRPPTPRSEGRRACALVTGASSGIGAAFARQLAAQGYDLALCARRAERLQALGEELCAQHGVRAEILPADLDDAADLERVAARAAALDDLEVLVNNAGFATEGRFARSDVERQLEMVRVHVLAAVRLARAALPGMLARRRGAIVNVSSVSAFYPLPGNVTYCSTKAYLNAFSETLQMELSGTGVRVQALCPGFTHTEFHDRLTRFDPRQLPELLWMAADRVVAQSLDALWDGPVVFVPGTVNRLLAGIARNGLTRPPAIAIMRATFGRRR